MSSTILPGPLVNASWLARHLYRPEVIIFDASLATPGDPPITEVGQQIGNAQFFGYSTGFVTPSLNCPI